MGAQLESELTGAIAAVMVIKHVDYQCFPSARNLRHSALAPSVVAAGYDVHDLVKQLDRTEKALLVNKRQLTYGVGVVEKMAMVFLKSPAPASAGALAPVRRAPRPSPAGSWARAVGPLFATDKAVWR